jgi:hypothetical protein
MLGSLEPGLLRWGWASCVGYVSDFSPEPHDVPLDAILDRLRRGLAGGRPGHGPSVRALLSGREPSGGLTASLSRSRT